MIDGKHEPQQIVPMGTGPAARPPVVTQGLLWVVLGGVVSSYLPYVGVFLLAYGMRELLEAKGWRGLAVSLGACVGICAVSCVFDIAYAAALAPLCLCAAGICGCMWRKRANVTGVSLVILLTAGLSLAIDAAFAVSMGESLMKTIQTVLTSSVRTAIGSGIQADVLYAQISPLVEALWPFAYVVSAMFNALLAGIGSHAMAVRCTGVARIPQIANFDAPMWCVGALALCILGLGATFTGIPEVDLVRSLCVTGLMSLRIVFALQGFGVVSALTAKRRMGCLTRFLITFITVWLETVCFAMCIVGLIDVWANFRKLARDGSDVAGTKQ